MCKKVCESVKYINYICVFLTLSLTSIATGFEKEFNEKIRPMLVKYCLDCHDPDDEDNESPFLEAVTLDDIRKYRHAWKSTAAQLRNRTMPPKRKKKQPTEFERIEVSTWIDNYLRESALGMPEYAGAITTRRLNRDEYNNTIRDLVGLDLGFSDSFPVDGGGGEGFDNNGETLFLPPLLMERYLESAQQILDKAVILPKFEISFDGSEMNPAFSNTPEREIKSGARIYTIATITQTGNFKIRLDAKTIKGNSTLLLKVDGITAHKFNLTTKFDSLLANVRLTRGIHSLTLVNTKKSSGVEFHRMSVSSIQQKVSDRRRDIHERIFTVKSLSQSKSHLRESALKNIRVFAKRAFRRPVTDIELSKFYALYDRAKSRGDSYEDSVKLALKAILVSPHFLFMVENLPNKPGIFRVNDFELASRLSYFLWASMPDKTLFDLAEKGELRKDSVLKQQVKRMLADEKSHAFFYNFTGQWLGTKDVGGKVAPKGRGSDIGYTPELGVALRNEPVEYVRYLVQNNRSLLELIESDYAMLNDKVAKHYNIKGVKGGHFRHVKVDGLQRGGILGLGGVHMVTSFPHRTSPVLRGAWVIETILGTPVPAPPDNVPDLKKKNKKQKLTIRQIFEKHRENDACAACHNLIDPIGFGLENYDLLGRWRTHEDGVKVDASGVMPSGEKFDGPKDLRKIILDRKDSFARHFISKMLGFSLGRSLSFKDAGTIERALSEVKRKNFSSQSLISSIVLSTPFRNREMADHKPAVKDKKH